MLKFFVYHEPDDKHEVTREEAIRSLLSTFRDSDLTHDWLTVVNRIPYRFGTITVEDAEAGRPNKVLMPGLAYQVPAGSEYDGQGNRI